LLLLVFRLDFGSLINDFLLIENNFLCLIVGVWIGALEFNLDQELSLFSERVFHRNTERFKCARVLIENSIKSCLGNNSRRNCDIVHTLISDFDKRNFKL
jgi:hypothetical protein